MAILDCKKDKDWLKKALEAVHHQGCVIVENVLSPSFVAELVESLHSVEKKIKADIGEERLVAAKEIGILRLMMKYEPKFLELLEVPEILDIVDNTVSNTAIMHLQNGFILPPIEEKDAKKVFQNTFHRDFPRYLNGYLASINTFMTLSEFNERNGSTKVVLGTHQKAEIPDPDFLEENSISVECAPGSMLVFDSTLWHCSGVNRGDHCRYSINHQFTRSFFKQQIDYVRALQDVVDLQSLPDRTQQLLGGYTQVVTSLDEYYRPADQRLYRSGQG